MKATARLGVLGFAWLVGCHSGANHGPGTPCPCRAPLACVQGRCEIADGAADRSDSTSDLGDGPADGGGGTGDGGSTGGGGGAGGAGAGTSGSGGLGGTGGSGGTGQTGGTGGASPPPPTGMCDDSAVSVACPVAPASPGCDEIFCGQRLWQASVRSY